MLPINQQLRAPTEGRCLANSDHPPSHWAPPTSAPLTDSRPLHLPSPCTWAAPGMTESSSRFRSEAKTSERSSLNTLSRKILPSPPPPSLQHPFVPLSPSVPPRDDHVFCLSPISPRVQKCLKRRNLAASLTAVIPGPGTMPSTK